jgi:DNA repair protein RecO (recombination protein O)
MKRALDGLVLRELRTGDNDRRVLILTADEGKMWLTAKGARSTKSKVAPLCRIFTYANLEIYDKNGSKWLSGGSINNSFSGINGDIVGFSLASYILQLADELSGENMEAEEVLRTTLNTLYAIEKKLKPYAQIKATYELFAANVSGMMPNLEECPGCRKRDFSDDGELWLDVMNGTVICKDCLSKRSGGLPLPEVDSFETRNIIVPINASVLEAMRYIASAPPQRLFAFGLSDARSMELFSRAAETYLLNHLERDFDTLHFYNSIKEEK